MTGSSPDACSIGLPPGHEGARDRGRDDREQRQPTQHQDCADGLAGGVLWHDISIAHRRDRLEGPPESKPHGVERVRIHDPREDAEDHDRREPDDRDQASGVAGPQGPIAQPAVDPPVDLVGDGAQTWRWAVGVPSDVCAVGFPDAAQQRRTEVLLAHQRRRTRRPARPRRTPRSPRSRSAPPRSRDGLRDPARGLDPADAGHPHVEQDQLGSQALDRGHRLLARLHVADRLESGRRAITSRAAWRKTAWSSTVRTLTSRQSRSCSGAPRRDPASGGRCLQWGLPV